MVALAIQSVCLGQPARDIAQKAFKSVVLLEMNDAHGQPPVSYTHLDVYKRQRQRREPGRERLTLTGARIHNLRGVDVEIPLNLLCCRCV